MAKSRELARMIPKSTTVKVGEMELIVPGDVEENRILNHITAAKIRSILDKNIEKFHSDEDKLSPKEMRDLAEAGKALAEYSNQLFQGTEQQNQPIKEVEQVQEADFSKIQEAEATEEKK